MDILDSPPTRAALTYLKAIYECSDGPGFVTTSQLAEHLAVAPASVTAMIQKLAACTPPLVEYHKHHGVRLAPVGQQLALRMIRRHRLLEVFLVQALGYSVDEVHAEADLLENSVSPRLEERLARFTGHPAYDPHGAPIPAEDLSVPTLPAIALDRLAPGKKGTVRRIRSGDAGLLHYLTDLGITIGAQIEVISQVPYDGILQVRVNQQGETRALGNALTTLILVEESE